MMLCLGLLPEGVCSAGTNVDDPLSSFVGDEAIQDDAIVKVVGGLLALGYKLASSKAQYSRYEKATTWTSTALG